MAILSSNRFSCSSSLEKQQLEENNRFQQKPTQTQGKRNQMFAQKRDVQSQGRQRTFGFEVVLYQCMIFEYQRIVFQILWYHVQPRKKLMNETGK